MKIFNISNYTYLLILISILCGYIKNIIIIFSICIFHELGHILLIKIFKYKINKVYLYPFGCKTNIDKHINSPINIDLIISLGGFINQGIIFILLLMFKSHINPFTYNLIYNYNKYILLFNMIPIIPLDGAKITELLLEKIYSYNKSYKINFVISISSLILFTVFNIIKDIDNYYIIIFLIYSNVLYIRNYKYLYNRFILERFLYRNNYKKIDSNTSSIKELKKEVLHYFYKDSKYINEKDMIKEEYFT